MNRQTQIQAEFVEFIPEQLEPGKLYISRRYSTAVHLCCCGCDLEVVTPLNSAKWHLSEHDNTVSLYPSIGNWGFPCQSHYWITKNRVQWASTMSLELIEATKRRDRLDAEIVAQRARRLGAIRHWASKLWTKTIGYLRRLFRL